MKIKDKDGKFIEVKHKDKDKRMKELLVKVKKQEATLSEINEVVSFLLEKEV